MAEPARAGATGVPAGILAAAAFLLSTAATLAQDGENTAQQAMRPRNSANVFISGHSLTDKPLGEYISAIATSLGKSIRWNHQIYIGSPIRSRTTRDGFPRWSGVSNGHNKFGASANVLDELRSGSVIKGRYDTLLITERHDVVSVLIWENTVRELRDYHERLIENVREGQTYFYQPWLDMSDMAEPERWITFERESTKIWQCAVTRVNVSLAAEKRGDRIQMLPIGLGLVELVERAMAGRVDGLKGSNTRALMKRIFTDGVHLTSTGVYYAALMSYAGIYQQPPAGAWRPSELNAPLATALQALAWDTVSTYYTKHKPLDLSECRNLMRSYCDLWNTPENNQPNCTKYFTSDKTDGAPSQRNPFLFDAVTDKTYWYPPPSR